MVSRRRHACLCKLANLLMSMLSVLIRCSKPRMTYASSKEALKNALPGLAAEVQANRDDEIEYETILKDVSKGRR